MIDDTYPEEHRPVSDPEAEGLPETADDDSNAWDDDQSTRMADGPDPAALPADHPTAVDRFGTTAAEQRRGESLDERLAEEEPDVSPEGPERPVGRLVQPDEGIGGDTEPDEVARDVGFAGGGLSAEEAAVYEVPEDQIPDIEES